MTRVLRIFSLIVLLSAVGVGLTNTSPSIAGGSVFPQVAASGTTLFKDNFDSSPATPGPVYSWNQPAGATSYEPCRTLSCYPAYQKNLFGLFTPGGANACTQDSSWSITANPVHNSLGKLSGTYYLAFDTNWLALDPTTYNWYQDPSVALSGSPTGETVVTVSGSNNAISLSLSLSNLAANGGGGTINLYRAFITATSGAEATSSDYFNVTYSPTVSLTIYSLSTASTGVHGVGKIMQCDPWPPAPYALGPNAIFAVTSERAHSGSNSLLIGGSDLGYDKTSTKITLLSSAVPYPSNNYLQYSFAIWLSSGVCSNDNNAATSPGIMMVGDTLGYNCNIKGDLGPWHVRIPGYGIFLRPGVYYLTTQTWHVVTVTFDLSVIGQAYYDLTIDGNRPSWVTGPSGLPGGAPLRETPLNPRFPLTDPNGNWMWAFWLNQQAVTNLSRATAGNSNGAYMYVDDISITLLPGSGLTSSSSPATSSTSSTNSSTTATNSSSSTISSTVISSTGSFTSPTTNTTFVSSTSSTAASSNSSTMHLIAAHTYAALQSTTTTTTATTVSPSSPGTPSVISSTSTTSNSSSSVTTTSTTLSTISTPTCSDSTGSCTANPCDPTLCSSTATAQTNIQPTSTIMIATSATTSQVSLTYSSPMMTTQATTGTPSSTSSTTSWSSSSTSMTETGQSTTTAFGASVMTYETSQGTIGLPYASFDIVWDYIILFGIACLGWRTSQGPLHQLPRESS